jgi:hypothetical protein
LVLAAAAERITAGCRIQKFLFMMLTNPETHQVPASSALTIRSSNCSMASALLRAVLPYIADAKLSIPISIIVVT